MKQEQNNGFDMQVAKLNSMTTQLETSADVDLSALRLQVASRIVLIGIGGVVSTVALVVLLLWLLPGGLPIVATLSLAVSAVAVIGTLAGVAVGHLLGASGKEQAEKRADKAIALLLKQSHRSSEPA